MQQQPQELRQEELDSQNENFGERQGDLDLRVQVNRHDRSFFEGYCC